MDLLKILKFIVFLVSFVMFFYQFNIATQNLMHPGIVDISYERDITVDDLPLVTVCPVKQANYTKLRELKYFLSDYLLSGEVFLDQQTKIISWGAHVNLTFDELKNQVLDLERFNGLSIFGGEFKNSSVFVPGYGFCQETLFLDNNPKVVLKNLNRGDTRILITDRHYRSYFMPDVSSHVGKDIFMKPMTTNFVNVKIQETYTCKNEMNQMSEIDFKKCVDDKVQKEFEKNNVSCLPPWLSANNQCNQTYASGIYSEEFLIEFFVNYVDIVSIVSNIWLEEECRQSCKETTYIVSEKGAKPEFESYAIVTLNQKVVVIEKVPNYVMFNYIIDVGSSLGLWLGLSVLGLHDLLVWAVQLINSSFIIKKIRSAVTK